MTKRQPCSKWSFCETKLGWRWWRTPCCWWCWPTPWRRRSGRVTTRSQNMDRPLVAKQLVASHTWNSTKLLRLIFTFVFDGKLNSYFLKIQSNSVIASSTGPWKSVCYSRDNIMIANKWDSKVGLNSFIKAVIFYPRPFFYFEEQSIKS